VTTVRSLAVVRIVSVLPSATETLFELGRGDDVVGVTFECNFS
jgi:iron complex transport system substrate-binding protein